MSRARLSLTPELVFSAEMLVQESLRFGDAEQSRAIDIMSRVHRVDCQGPKRCNGTGIRPGSKRARCRYCSGRGYFYKYGEAHFRKAPDTAPQKTSARPERSEDGRGNNNISKLGGTA
jgi:DnaJ-class molecular chaperone